MVDEKDCAALGATSMWVPVYFNPCSSCVNLDTLKGLPDRSHSQPWFKSLGMYLYLLIGAAALALLACMCQ